MTPEIATAQQFLQHQLGVALTMERIALDLLATLEQRSANDGVKELFAAHASETEAQIGNVEQALSAVLGRPQAQPSPAIDGLQRQAQETLQRAAAPLYDAIALAAAAEVEHYEIAVYEGLLTTADVLGEQDVVALVQENLEQERHVLPEVLRYAHQVAHKLEQVERG